jgi:hypothetical protein
VALNSTRTTAIVVVLAAFAAGLLAGVAGDRIYLIHKGRYYPTRGGGRSMAKHLVEKLDRELHFDGDQRKKVETIVESHRKHFESIWASARPAIEKELEATNAEIEKVLTADQRAKFKSMQLRMKNRHHGEGPPPGPPPRRD